LELQDLYNEALVRELLEKTKSCGLVWVHLGGSQFQATSINEAVNPNVTWEFILTRTQIGNVTDAFTLDVKKDTITYVSIESGPLPKSGRESVVQELFEVVETIVLALDVKLKETVQFVQGITDCRS
jgi:hypothetical protein